VAGIVYVLAVVAESAVGLGVGINQNDSAAKIATELADHRTRLVVVEVLCVVYAARIECWGFGNRWFAGGGRTVRGRMVFPFVSQTMRPFLVSLNHPDMVALRALNWNSQITPVIDRVFPLSEGSQAIEYVGGGHAGGKVVIGV
jgi:hypothetical protein